MRIMIGVLLLIIIFSCNDRSNKRIMFLDSTGKEIDKNMLLREFEEEYPEFYRSNRLDYEISHNGYDKYNKLYNRIFMNKALKMIDYADLNYPYPSYEEFSIFEIQKKYINNSNQFIFFKRYRTSPIFYKDYLVYHYEYPITDDGKQKMMILAFQYSYDNPNLKAAYIKWTSKPANTMKYLNWNREPIYMWGINASTDSIETNLPYKLIKSFFKDFKGNYTYKNYDSIIVDYSVLEKEKFFKNIQFKE